MKSVLIPVDFSKGSLNSCKYAVEIADKNTSVSLWIFHVYADQMVYQPSYDIDGIMMDPVIDYEFFEEMKKIATDNLEKLKQELNQYIEEKGYKNIVVKSFMVQGTADWLINDVCEELTPDVIVMSTHGAGNKEPFEGRMAKRIMGKTKVPVVAIPDSFSDYALKKVLYSIYPEIKEENVSFIKMLMKKMQHKNPDFVVTYFKESEHDNAEFDYLNEAFEEEIDAGKIKLLSVESNINVKTVVYENDVDMIVFVAHKENPFKHLFKRRVSKEDFFEANVPVMGLPKEND